MPWVIAWSAMTHAYFDTHGELLEETVRVGGSRAGRDHVHISSPGAISALSL
jgi:hypothetical protein